MALDPSSRTRLTTHALGHFGGDGLFDRVARAVCRAGVLPRKELYESWEMARRVRRLYKNKRIFDLAAGHGLLAQILLILDATSPGAIAVDRKRPPSAEKIARELGLDWPSLIDRFAFVEASIDVALPFAIEADDLVVAQHACGPLTDRVLTLAIEAGASVAVLPCCHALTPDSRSPLEGWIDGALASDIERLVRLRNAGYRVKSTRIPPAISPKNRLLLANLPAL